jgi:hypothetical protein
MLSYYNNLKEQKGKVISLENYITFIKLGTEQDLVLNARIEKQKGNDTGYKALKSMAKCVTGSAVMHEGAKSDANIKELNGLIVIDIDCEISNETVENLKSDKYTHVLHRSFGGDGICIFVKINSDLFAESFNGLAQYYFENYNIAIDQSCKNRNRLRFISYDPDIYVNEKSEKFKAKKQKVKPLNIPKYVYVQDDFDFILEQIKNKRVDLCQESYERYVRIGLALAFKFGIGGMDNFKFICSFGSKYNERHAERDYKGFCKNTGSCTIGTFYYYCKEAGIETYTPKTKTIIQKVKTAKVQGNPTLETVCKSLKIANEIEASEQDKVLISELIESKIDYEVSTDLTEIELLENFIIDTYNPYFDVITDTLYIQNAILVTDNQENDIYLDVKRHLNDKVQMSDIRAILNSSKVRKINTLENFLNDNKSNPTGIIDSYIDCINPKCEYNRWAFKKWIVGAVHNWTANYNDKIVSPLTLVLTGRQHGTGKTSFLRNILPKELQKYSVEAKISGQDKDSMALLCSNLLVCDDEFGGKAFKDVNEYKAISDSNIITQRLAYRRNSKNYKRRAVLCGTTNEIDILKDVTGNRRILPISVESTDYDKFISISKTDLIIEAYNLLQSGFEWSVRTHDDLEYLAKNTENNNVVLPFEDLFLDWFSFNETTYYNAKHVLNQGELLEMFNKEYKTQFTKYDLKEVLTKHRAENKNYTVNNIQKRGYLLYCKPLNNPSF